jgi:type VI protein secretion system component VasK
MKAKIEAIQNDFLNALDSDNPVDGLKRAVAALEKLGSPRSAACHIVTHWAMEDGLFDPEDEAVAEQQAERIVDAA